MHALSGIFAVTFPFFALVLCGYLAARARLLPLDAVAGLNMFVLYFALPCMLYRFGASTPAAQLFSPVVALIWMGAAALLVAVSAGWARRRGASWPDAAMGALVAVFPNSGFMGVPLILALLGEGALGPVMATLLVDLVVTTSVCIGLSQWGAAGEHGPAKALGRALQGVLRNPMPWSILLGALAGATGFALWAPLGRTVQLLADSASPVALFTIGAVLARSQMQTGAPRADAARAPKDVGLIVLLKLAAHPALVWALGCAAVRAGIWPAALLAPLVLTAALPAASNVSLLAERFGADNGRVARVILYSTALAFFSFSAAVALLR
ncbi:MAG: AEC family transporter [Burkholderiales bacterium]|nr:AEC family transporter [Burkholderiales bacterium]MBS0414706.1 AEC family transporter [Pseudomonadota bacterium]